MGRRTSDLERGLCLLLAMTVFSACAVGPARTTSPGAPAPRVPFADRAGPSGLATVSAAIAGAIPPAETDPHGSRLAERIAERPLRFEANPGQADPAIGFLSRGSDYELHLGAAEAVLGYLDCRSEQPSCQFILT